MSQENSFFLFFFSAGKQRHELEVFSETGLIAVFLAKEDSTQFQVQYYDYLTLGKGCKPIAEC